MMQVALHEMDLVWTFHVEIPVVFWSWKDSLDELQEYAKRIGADMYAADAVHGLYRVQIITTAVNLTRKLLQ